MKKKKEIGIPKTQYIFQRYNGIITKYIINEEYYIDVETGIAMKKNETILLGNISENIIDLIEVDDIVHTRDVLNEDIVYIWSEEYLKAIKEDLSSGIELVDILTKEQYMKNCYKVKKGGINMDKEEFTDYLILRDECFIDE